MGGFRSLPDNSKTDENQFMEPDIYLNLSYVTFTTVYLTLVRAYITDS